VSSLSLYFRSKLNNQPELQSEDYQKVCTTLPIVQHSSMKLKKSSFKGETV